MTIDTQDTDAQAADTSESLINADGTDRRTAAQADSGATAEGPRRASALVHHRQRRAEPSGRRCRPGNWSTSFRVLSREPWVVECTLTVCGVSRADVGYSNAPDSEDEAEPAKAAYSDALKRAAVSFGIGRWLYEA